ncbi:hypothetical protein [Streptomyces profundus]|uniref:hypothetical protein n=1 Tax=Streptomyces profundus TaxID=2867410 RepID=UPI001D167A13|nr:hypothetical protein [Streptomyces sp. MA3_2.13]UED85167.1 hypothetical protein K4G22_13965 [Streptomyces sp. MA3_2.13]
MNTAIKVGAFGAGITLTFGAAFGVGHLVGPVGSDPEPAAHGAHGDGDDGASEERGEGAGERGAPGGLQISERGYTLAPDQAPLPAGERTDFTFRILGPDGAPLTDYEEAHDKELHLIVVRRDLSGFQHVHPELSADGTWSVPLTFEQAGEHRVFADFTPADDPAGGLTLGADVAVTGPYEPRALPAAERTASVDGYSVTLGGEIEAGAESELTLTVADENGEPVTDLEPYLGAYGHLVALRAGDLGYLHVHPQGEPGDGVTPAGPGITFHTEVPSAGTYRLYLDFQHRGEVRTAEFTVRVGDTAPAAPEEPGDHRH